MSAAGPARDVEGRVALISGGSSGIGLEVARALQATGWQLSLGLRRPVLPPGLASNTHLAPHDAERGDEAAWVAAAVAHFGHIDALVCSAWVMNPGDILDLPDADLQRMWEVNVRALRLLVAAAWPELCAAGARAQAAADRQGAVGGRVLILGSLSGLRVKSAGSAGYAMTKHAVVALGHGLRQAGHAEGIRTTVVCPGFVDTDMARAITDFSSERMTRAGDVARLARMARMARMALELPNTAALATLSISCQPEDIY